MKEKKAPILIAGFDVNNPEQWARLLLKMPTVRQMLISLLLFREITKKEVRT